MAATTTAATSSRTSRETASSGPAGPWHKRCPRSVSRAYEASEDRGWAAWQKHLAERKVAAWHELFAGKTSPLAWALPEHGDWSASLKLIAMLDRLEKPAGRKAAHLAAIETAAASWLASGDELPTDDGSSAEEHDIALGLECLAWCAALPRLTAALGDALWWALLGRLTSLASSARPENPLAPQLLGVELPLALAYSFAELETCQTLVEAARRIRDEAEAELLDGEGLLHGRHLHLLRPLLACWTRAGVVEGALEGSARNGARRQTAGKQFAGLLEHALRLSRPNGQAVFSPPDAAPWNSHLLKSARQLAGDDPATKRVLRLAEQGTAGASGKAARRTDQPAASFEGEWAELALLRPDWTRSAPRLAVSYVGRRVLVELNVGKQTLFSGEWGLDVRLNGKPLEIVGNWEQVAWERADGCDYLELEIQLADEVVVQRHMVLARRDGILFMADAVLGIQQGSLEYHGTLPLAGWSTFAGVVETREGSLVVEKRPRARVLPLALGEWRSSPTAGSLHVGTTGLELAQKAEAQSLLAPLFIDLNAARLSKETTWRQLTVAAKREIVSRDAAVGYRAQVGKLHWLIYRSLSAPEVRTVLGANLMHEFMIGRFQADGSVETLLEIEAAS